MSDLDPAHLFDLIAEVVPSELHEHVVIVGSLAAAYHHRDRLGVDRINTKDADVVVQPAGAVDECRRIAQRLLEEGWRPTDVCRASVAPTPVSELSVIRLRPPTSDAFFFELLGLPERDQAEAKLMRPLELREGWFVVPLFRYFSLLTHGQRIASCGIPYAAPEMMALANLLAHPELGTARVSAPIGGRQPLRAAKDLGRVLALARLATTAELEAWPDAWEQALRETFEPDEVIALGARSGAGLRALLEDEAALEDAHHTVDLGLLRGHDVTLENLRAIGAQVLAYAVGPIAERSARTR